MPEFGITIRLQCVPGDLREGVNRRQGGSHEKLRNKCLMLKSAKSTRRICLDRKGRYLILETKSFKDAMPKPPKRLWYGKLEHLYGAHPGITKKNPKQEAVAEKWTITACTISRQWMTLYIFMNQKTKKKKVGRTMCLLR